MTITSPSGFKPARHRFIDWVRRKFDQHRFTSETLEFLNRLKTADRMPLAITSVLAADVAARLYAFTDGGIDLLYPREALVTRPTLLYELTEAVIQLQAAGRQLEAPGTLMWVCTLRAEMFPSLRPLVKELWSLVAEGGFTFERQAVALCEEKLGCTFPYNGIFRRPPNGFWDYDEALNLTEREPG
jgi:hypothetical protein